MDETQIAAILSVFDTKLATDPQIRAILRKITGGKATFADTADYAIRAGNLLGQFLSGEILDISPEDREVLCAALLKKRYTDLNKLLGTVQRAQDKPLGISLNPIKAPFPAERVQQVAHSLLDPGVKPEVIRRRANAPVATVAKSFHDDYIRINAQKRQDLGFKCYLNRVAVNGCCPWCTEVAGRYVYGDHPADIFRRHDNCDCTVTFENGRQRQDVWSKRTWEADPEDVMQNASEPTFFTQEQAEKLQAKLSASLTKPGQGSIINTSRVEPANSHDILEFTNSLHELGFQKVEGFDNYSESREHLLEIFTDFAKMHNDFPQYFDGVNLCLGICEGMDDRVYAGYLHENETLYLNPLYYNNIEMYSKQYAKDVRDNYHPKGTSYRSTIFHEFGHRVEAVSGESGKKLAKQFFEEHNGRYFTRKLGDEWTSRNLSIYAYEFNYDDFIPESFAEFYGSESPRIVCQQVVESLKNRGA